VNSSSTSAADLALLGMGTAVPDAVIDQAEGMAVARLLCCRTVEQETWLPGIYQGSGIETRRLCLGRAVLRDVLEGTRHTGSVFLPTGGPDDRGPTTRQRLEHYVELAPPLALAASRQALDQAGVAGQSITHLITVSCTGFFAPGLDLVLIGGLGLPATVERTHVGFMGCHGAINGLRVARAFAGADPDARVLVCAAELCSIHYHYGWHPQRMVANALFSDGAAAVVAGPATEADGWRVRATGSCLLPESAAAMTWTIGDHGFEMTLSRQVPALIARHLRPWLHAWLGRHGLTVEQVPTWAIHPGGPRILTAVEEALGLPAQATATSRQVFAEYGNMSSPTVLFILERLRRAGAARPCVAMGFGPGLMAEAALID
jgi:predicted naringenin-chalcone synthase